MLTQKPLCTHPSDTSQIIPPKTLTTCSKCGCIIYNISPTIKYPTTKPYYYQTTPISPSLSFPIPPIDNTSSSSPQLSTWYLKYRCKIIKMLNKYQNIDHYNEAIYYLSLALLDNLLKTSKFISKSKLELTVITVLVLSAKFKAINILEPNLARYTSFEGIVDIDETDIKRTEVEILKNINYEMTILTVDDVLNHLMYNGFVFEIEIQNKPKEYINIIYGYAKKILNDIMKSEHIVKYNAFQIGISVVHLTRKKFDLKNNYFSFIKKYYNVHIKDYKECLEICKKIINNEIIESQYYNNNNNNNELNIQIEEDGGNNVNGLEEVDQPPMANSAKHNIKILYMPTSESKFKKNAVVKEFSEDNNNNMGTPGQVDINGRGDDNKNNNIQELINNVPLVVHVDNN
jgi:hypothetical protein